jgi:hypothetical protein
MVDVHGREFSDFGIFIVENSRGGFGAHTHWVAWVTMGVGMGVFGVTMGMGVFGMTMGMGVWVVEVWVWTDPGVQ